MSEFLDKWFNVAFVIAMAMLIGIPLLGGYIDAILKRKFRSEIEKAIDGAFANSNSVDLEYVRTMLNSISRKWSQKLITADVLEDYLTKLSVRAPETQNASHIDYVRNLLRHEREHRPYESLPDDEKRLLRAVADAIEHDDKESMRFHVRELAAVLAVRSQSNAWIRKMNQWSVPLAVVGLILTVVFGIAGILK